MMPGSWGLRGKTRAVAEAEYLYEGDELTAKLAEIEADGDPVQSELNVLAAQLKAGELTHPEYEKECANAKGEPFVNVLDMGIDPDNGWRARYEILPGKEKVVSELKRLAKDSDAIYLATDLDREGEAIAWHLQEAIGGDSSRYHRVVFNEITPS
mgnify:CR=1 FL=1